MKKSGTAPQTKTGKELSGWEKTKAVFAKINHVIDIIGLVLFRFRKFILAAPVAYLTWRLAVYNLEHLPEEVGLGLQATGEFAMTVARGMAVTGPAALTAGCLVLMFLSRKAMYPWAISVFTLVLPLLLLISNIYPA